MGNQPPAPPPRFEGEKTTKIVIYFQKQQRNKWKNLHVFTPPRHFVRIGYYK